MTSLKGPSTRENGPLSRVGQSWSRITGRVLAEAAGWTATTLVARSFGGDGWRFAALAEEHRPDLVLLGTRGLSGTSAMMQSFADPVVHHSPVPVLVVPHPLLTDDREHTGSGPVAVCWDGSPGAARALRHAAALLPVRELVTLSVGEARSAPGGTEPGDTAAISPTAVAEQLGRTLRHRTIPGSPPSPGRPAARPAG